MVRNVFKNVLFVVGILSLVTVSCGKNNGEPEKPVIRFLEISAPVVEIDGKAHVETVDINTNYEKINISGGEAWCTYRLERDNKAVTLTIRLNDGDDRQASIILTGVADEGETTRSILVKQSKGIVEYTLDCSAIDFEASKVVDVMHQGRRLAQICQEYIYTSDRSVDRQTAVLYPLAADGSLDLTRGLEISTGATVAWNLSDPETDACTCTGGDGKPVKMLYLCEGAISMESNAVADTVMSATLYPEVLSDMRGTEINTYKYVKIGTQYWMAENLRAEKYSNGKAISDIFGDASGSFLYYAFDPEFKAEFGTIYTGNALLNENGLAPKGWEIPSMTRWNKLYNYLGNKRGTKVKSVEWVESTEAAEYVNITGLSISAGYCWMPYGSDSGWNDESQRTYFWSTDTVEKSGKTEFRYVYFFKNSSAFGRSLNQDSGLDLSHGLDNGDYIRCVKDVK